MHEIARDTFDTERFYVVTRLMWEGMENQRPAAWKIVFKSLTLLEFLVKNGAERCVDDARNHGHILRALGQFNYYEGTIDRGLGVREKSKQILDILTDDERIREERQKARKALRKELAKLVKGAHQSPSFLFCILWDKILKRTCRPPDLRVTHLVHSSSHWTSFA